MPDCRAIDALVTPYVDGEIAPHDRRTIEEHLGVCPPCRARVGVEQSVRHLLTARRPELCTASAPAALHTRCAEAARRSESASEAAPGGVSTAPVGVRAVTSRSRTPWRSRVAPLALAATLVLIVGGAFLFQLTARSSRVMAAELAADHVKCFVLNGMLGTHQPAAVVESAMASGFGWPLHLPANPERVGLELLGSRPCLYGEGRIAHVMFRYNGEPLSLFMLPGAARTPEALDVLGHRAAIWSSGRRTFVVVAREPDAEVDRVATFFKASIR